MLRLKAALTAPSVSAVFVFANYWLAAHPVGMYVYNLFNLGIYLSNVAYDRGRVRACGRPTVVRPRGACASRGAVLPGASRDAGPHGVTVFSSASR